MKLMYTLMMCMSIMPCLHAQNMPEVQLGLFGGYPVLGGVMFDRDIYILDPVKYPYAGVYSEIGLHRKLAIINAVSYLQHGFKIGEPYRDAGIRQRLGYVDYESTVRFTQNTIGLHLGMQFLFLADATVNDKTHSSKRNRDAYHHFRAYPIFGIDWKPVPQFTCYLQVNGGLSSLSKPNLEINGKKFQYGLGFYAVTLGVRLSLKRIPYAQFYRVKYKNPDAIN